MLYVNVRDNAKGTQTIPVSDPAATTLRDVLTAANVDYSHGVTHLDGSPLAAGELSKTFAAFGITSGKCFLINVVKADNA